MNLKKIVGTFVLGGTALFASNQIINEKGKQKGKLETNSGNSFPYKHGDVHYTVHGTGSPIILLHDLDPIASSHEWKQVRRKLAEKYTVYTIDLLGCGLSEKPNLTYTNYMYVDMLTKFIDAIIKQKVDVIASNESSSIAINLKNMNANVRRIILINPVDLKDMNMETNTQDMALNKTLFTPIVGTSTYNAAIQEVNLKKMLKDKYFKDASLADKYLDSYYQAAHAENSNGRYLYASKKCKYLNSNIAHAIEGLKSVYIFTSANRPNAEAINQEYIDLNDKIKIIELPNSKGLPQLECPEEFIKEVKKICK